MMAKQEIIGIVGGGKMGRSLFKHLSKYDIKVVWVKRSNYKEEQKRLQRQLHREQSLGLLSTEAYESKKHLLQISKSLEDISDCSFVIEAIDENKTQKEQLYKRMSKIIAPTTLLVSNSSSMHPDDFDLPKNMKHRFAGLHFFFPVETNSLAELIVGQETSQETSQRIQTLCHFTEKKCILQGEDNAFAVNRFFLDLQASLFNHCTLQGLSFTKADKLIQEYLFPSGIFLMMEHISFPLLVKTIPHYMTYHPYPEQIYPLLSYLHKKHELGETRFDTPCTSRTSILNKKQEQDFIKSIDNTFKKIGQVAIRKGLFTADELLFVFEELTGGEYQAF